MLSACIYFYSVTGIKICRGVIITCVPAMLLWQLILTFGLGNYLHIFKTRLYERLDPAISSSVWKYVCGISGRIRVSRSWVQGQGHGSEKAVACNSKTTGPIWLGLDWNTITLKVIWSCWQLTFYLETYFRIFQARILSFECLNFIFSLDVHV